MFTANIQNPYDLNKPATIILHTPRANIVVMLKCRKMPQKLAIF